MNLPFLMKYYKMHFKGHFYSLFILFQLIFQPRIHKLIESALNKYNLFSVFDCIKPFFHPLITHKRSLQSYHNLLILWVQIIDSALIFVFLFFADWEAVWKKRPLKSRLAIYRQPLHHHHHHHLCSFYLYSQVFIIMERNF